MLQSLNGKFCPQVWSAGLFPQHLITGSPIGPLPDTPLLLVNTGPPQHRLCTLYNIRW